jgi:CopG family nickel-responsive transcriptional regulator
VLILLEGKEAVRELVRKQASLDAISDTATACVAVLNYVFDHQTRALAQRQIHTFHDHHDLSVASMHVHLDHESCLEVAVLKGTAGAVRTFADTVVAQRGVRHSNLQIIPVRVSNTRHDHGTGSVMHTHVHA